ncbi:MAG: alpha/beta fold hydrolase [Gemmatimonadales bacterium]
MRRLIRPSWWWLALPAAAAAAFLHGRPRPDQPLHRAEWLSADDATLRTLRAGTGDTTLLLLHGFGESLFTWRAVVDPLAQHFRVVAVDLPGFGGSSKAEASYTLSDMTRRLSGFIDQWVPGPIVVVGHSMGGEIAAALALERPDRILGAVLIAPAGWGVGLAGVADTMYPSRAKAIAWYLSSRAFVLPEHDPDWLHEPDSAADYTLVGDSAYRLATQAVLTDFDFRALRDRFKDLTQPVLLIWGPLDPVIPYEIADSLIQVIPCGGLATIPRALHRPQVEFPDTVTSLVRGFASAPSCPERAPLP